MGVLKELEPKTVFHYFEEISAVPRESGNMKPMGDYCENFAKEHNLEYFRDDMHNVIIVKEATKGYENSPAIIIQGHLDMVCAKTPESTIDFEKDGLELAIEGDLLYAKGTSLGGDNGIAVAMALAVLAADDLEHPRVEAVFTVDEETGLYGAEAVDVSMLKAKKFLNLDSEDEGVVTVSCAGGITAVCKLPVKKVSKDGAKIKVTIAGLQGGHSGIEIDKGRGNSDMLFGRFLYELKKELNLNVISAFGGMQDNAIPKETVAEILVAEGDAQKVEEAAKKYDQVLKNELKSSDANVTVTAENLGKATVSVLDDDSTEKFVFVLMNLPNGIQAMSMDIKDLVETSLNLGILRIEEDHASFVTSVRSSIESARNAVSDKVVSLFEFIGGSVEMEGAYPGWEYKIDSPLRDTVIAVYEKQYGEKPVIEAIHAGLECGMFSEKIEDLDCVSIGPSMTGVHTVDERLSISSVERTWKFVVGILQASK